MKFNQQESRKLLFDRVGKIKIIKIMALFMATIKENRWANGVQLEKGMNVQFVSNYSSPLSTNGGVEVIEAFMRKYCIDIKKANAVSDAWISIKKIN